MHLQADCQFYTIPQLRNDTYGSSLCRALGVCYLAERRKDRKLVAIKRVSVCMDKDSNRKRKQDSLRNEVNILQACNNPFVVKYYESFMAQKIRTEEKYVSQMCFGLLSLSFELLVI